MTVKTKFSATAVALVACELFRNLLPEKDDSKIKTNIGEFKYEQNCKET